MEVEKNFHPHKILFSDYYYFIDPVHWNLAVVVHPMQFPYPLNDVHVVEALSPNFVAL